ncbi:uncharacterized protein EAF02_006981 [Botrytis sinoallii]|uniref:uncharacterized protein n=1 Tax=Botrytis sinoallii TaxID=1463999 RepID=UPI001902A4D6|nr:uncharacterized protein EAF02_006981 [Botrytis sinoallii]KAF7881090.1 hypothetical protein EAF02_006981 [Botrytis sinoallii]
MTAAEHETVDKLPFTAVAAPDSYQSAEDRTAGTEIGSALSNHVFHAHQKDTGPPATKKELWSYYAYYAGNNGISSFQYSSLLFQNLIYQAGFNPNVLPLGSAPCGDDTPCHVFWNGGTKAYTSVVLIASGLTFVSQAVLFLSIGSLADFGNWNPWVVRLFSLLSFAFEFGFLGVQYAHQWRIAMALYIISSVTWWSSYVFFNAIFPKLAHDLPEVHKAREDYAQGTLTEQGYEDKCSMARSKVMNISYGWNNVGFTICGALALATLAGIGANDSTQQNNWGYSVSVAVTTGWWIILAIPWFIWEKKRPGPPLPKGDNYLTFGFKQTYFAGKQVWKLRQTFYYLIAFFLLADGVATLLTLVSIAQTQVVQFSATQNTYLIMVQGGSTTVGVFGAYYLQETLKIRTKTMLQFCNCGCVLIALWGMIGLWTTKFGFHNEWEFWLFQAQYGITLGAQFPYGQAFMAELVPKGREYLFFSLLGIVSKGSAWIGPIVSSAIVDRNGSQWAAFPFVAALIFVPTVAIFWISETKSRVECAEYLERERTDLQKIRDNDLNTGRSDSTESSRGLDKST